MREKALKTPHHMTTGRCRQITAVNPLFTHTHTQCDTALDGENQVYLNAAELRLRRLRRRVSAGVCRLM